MLKWIDVVLWFAACVLVIYSWLKFEQNIMAHAVFFAIFAGFLAIGFALNHFYPQKRRYWLLWVLLKTMLIVAAILTMVGEHHRLFHEQLSLFD